ncbi:3-oxoacyl-ACP reductase family protein [Geomonas sp.]|uniref:3-oxoacyl-ACP reductase family protein n=1 Tax=Geomonas sp. TaxID=2651584 RepID=UPI002B499919|nr:3-oxoacyl-ACP reductase family protein [Geomonas sp.]HJV36277.1 3-oxoacyl-ACP reductase family protein [Geomonas sp.]
MEFEYRSVIVTGGTRGIGRAISLHFARLGATVTAAYLNNDVAAQELVREAASLAGSISTVKADVSTSEGAKALIDAAWAAHGSLDILVNNAGIIRDCYLPMMSEADWDSVVRGNLDPLFHCCKWGVRKMMAKRRGVIVNLSSVSAFSGTAGQTNYAASKGAAVSFTKSLAREVGPMGIRVNAVAPGLIETEMIAGMKGEVVERIVGASALGRMGRVEEVAEAVAFLASDRASYITGQCLVIDGGIL